MSIEQIIEEIANRVYDEREAERPRTSQAMLLDAEAHRAIKQLSLIAHKPYLTRREAAIYLDISERSIGEWVKRQDDQNPFPESSAGGEPRYRREKIDEWAERENKRRRAPK